MARNISRETTFPSMVKFLPDGGARLVQVRGDGTNALRELLALDERPRIARPAGGIDRP